jgi:hypothetical protein
MKPFVTIDADALARSQVGAAENLAGIVSGGIAAPIAGGLAYIPAAIMGGDAAGQHVKSAVEDTFTYKPRTASGVSQIESRNALAAPIMEGIGGASESLGNVAAKAAGAVGADSESKAAAYAAGKTAIPAAMAAVGMKMPAIRIESPGKYFSSISGKSGKHAAQKPSEALGDLIDHANASASNFDAAGWAKINTHAKYYGGVANSGDTIVLTRYASSRDDLLKETITPADGVVSKQSMFDTAVKGSGGGIPTSLFKVWEKSPYGKNLDHSITFTVSKSDLKKMIDDGHAILGNAFEGEIILNPIVARNHISSVSHTPRVRKKDVKTNYTSPVKYNKNDLPPPPPESSSPIF